MHYRHILIISDIEGSSGCWDYAASRFMTEPWCRACAAMSQDVNAVGQALLDAGVEHVRVKDFHRSGFNLLPELIDPRIAVASGYRRRPVPGIGDPGDVEAVLFLGMHAASGTPGFLAHTLTSRLEQLEVNGKPLAEVELFSASLAPWAIRPLFFSGCPTACAQARQAMGPITVYPIDKSTGPHQFDVHTWREGLARAAVASLRNETAVPYTPSGPFRALIRMKEGEKAAGRWGFSQRGDQIVLETEDIHSLYLDLVRLCYLTPLIERTLPVGLWLYNLRGRIGRAWVRRRLKGQGMKAV